jgi:hypothetical protein
MPVSKTNKEIIPSDMWHSELNVGYKTGRLNVTSGIGYSSFVCSNKIAIHSTDNSGNNIGSKYHTGHYTARYVSVPLGFDYEIVRNKPISPFVGACMSTNIKVGSGFETDNTGYVASQPIYSSKSFFSVFALVGIKAKVSKKFEATIKTSYQYNYGRVFYSNNESLYFNGIGVGLGLNYIW